MEPADEFNYAKERDDQRLRLRAAILDAAASLLSDRGLDDMSVRAIASRVGSSTKVIYSHFGGKPGIVDALYRDGFEQLAGAVRGAANGEGGVLERLGRVAEAYRSFALRSPPRYELMFGPRVRDLLPSAPQRNPVLGASQVIADLLRTGQAEGTIRPGDVHHQTKFLWSAYHATVSLELVNWFADDEAADNHQRLTAAALQSLRLGREGPA